MEGEQPAGLAVLPRQRRQQGPVPGLRRPAGQQLLGRRLGVSRRHHQHPLGEPVRRRRLLDVRRSVRPQLHLRRGAGRLHVGRVNRKTLEARDIQPQGAATRRSCASTGTRRSRLSPNEKGTIYIGAQFLFRSRDHGQTWERISPDLTTNDPIRQKQEQSGGITVDNSSAEMHTTIYSISESPRAAGQIWVGTDDGNVQLTRDGGKNWTNLTPNLGMPAGQLDQLGRGEPLRSRGRVRDLRPPHVRRHEALSLPHDRLRPHLAAAGRTGHARRPRLRARDQGRPGQAEHPVPRHRVRPVHLARTAASRGRSSSRTISRTVAVRDLALQARDDDLVLATHGRGIWIIDDITPLRALTSATLASSSSAHPGPARRAAHPGQWRLGRGRRHLRRREPAERRRHHLLPEGAARVRADEARDPRRQRQGRRRNSGLEASAASTAWPGRCAPSRRIVPPAASLAGSSTAGERFLPGTYTVRLTKAGQVSTEPLTLTLDKRATFSVADRQAQFAAVGTAEGHVPADEQARRPDQRRSHARSGDCRMRRPPRRTSKPPQRNSAERPTRCARKSSPRRRAAQSPARSGCASM